MNCKTVLFVITAILGVIVSVVGLVSWELGKYLDDIYPYGDDEDD